MTRSRDACIAWSNKLTPSCRHDGCFCALHPLVHRSDRASPAFQLCLSLAVLSLGSGACRRSPRSTSRAPMPRAHTPPSSPLGFGLALTQSHVHMVLLVCAVRTVCIVRPCMRPDHGALHPPAGTHEHRSHVAPLASGAGHRHVARFFHHHFHPTILERPNSSST